MVELNGNATYAIPRSHHLLRTDVGNFKRARVVVMEWHWSVFDAQHLKIWIQFVQLGNQVFDFHTFLVRPDE